MLMDNQVDFVQSSILDGVIDQVSKAKQKKKQKKDNQRKAAISESESSSSDSEIDQQALIEAEKNLTPEEKKRLELQHQKENLPMFHYRDELLGAIRDHQVVIIVAETGSGKTT